MTTGIQVLDDAVVYTTDAIMASQPDTPARFSLQPQRDKGLINFVFAFGKESFSFDLTLTESLALQDAITQTCLRVFKNH